MPFDEITEVYSFYRDRLLHRSLAGSERVIAITINSWEEILFSGFFRVIRIVMFISVNLYIFFNSIATYYVSKDNNYLWFSLLILSAILSNAYLTQYTIGIKQNPHNGQICLSLILIFMIQFLKIF